MTDRAMMQRIKQNVLEVDPQAEVWLYGSRARGTANEESDWDVLVLTPQETVTTAEESRFVDHMCDLIVETGEVIQLFSTINSCSFINILRDCIKETFTYIISHT